MIAACVAGATVAFNHALALPLAEPFLAGLAALGLGDRLPLHRRRQGSPTAAEEFCAVPRPARHQPDAVVEQAAGTRRRDPQRDGVLLGHRGIFADRGNDVARQPDGADERISFGDDRHHRRPWRLCRQIYRQFHRRGVRRAGRRSRPCRQCGARRAGLLRDARRTQRLLGPASTGASWRSASGSIPARRWSAISDRSGASTIRS